MSRAFVKESDGDSPDDGLPEKQKSKHPNYVTAQGLAELRRQLDEVLTQVRTLDEADDELAAKAPRVRLKREIRYLERRIDDAIVVDAKERGDEVTIGASVTIDDGKERRTFKVVGEDEADPTQGLISWTSPLGRALMGSKLGATVVWERPVGDVTVTIVDIRS